MLPRIEPGLIGPNSLLIKSREFSGVGSISSLLSVDVMELLRLRKGSVVEIKKYQYKENKNPVKKEKKEEIYI